MRGIQALFVTRHDEVEKKHRKWVDSITEAWAMDDAEALSGGHTGTGSYVRGDDYP